MSKKIHWWQEWPRKWPGQQRCWHRSSEKLDISYKVWLFETWFSYCKLSQPNAEADDEESFFILPNDFIFHWLADWILVRAVRYLYKHNAVHGSLFPSFLNYFWMPFSCIHLCPFCPFKSMHSMRLSLPTFFMQLIHEELYIL